MWFVGFGTWFTVASWDISKHKIFLDRITVHWNLEVFLATSALFSSCHKVLNFCLYFCYSLSVLHSSGEYSFCKPKVKPDHFLMTAESTKIHLSLYYQATAISDSKAVFMSSLSLWMTVATWMQGIEMENMLFWMYIYANIFTETFLSKSFCCLRLLYISPGFSPRFVILTGQ